MGTLTFKELQDEVRFGLGGRTDQDARLPRIINLAQQRLARIHDFDEMETLSTVEVNNTSNVTDKILTLPAKREVFSIILLDGANSAKLVQRTQRFWDRKLPMPEYWTRNRPQEYVLWGDTAEIWPMPNATYTLRIRWSKWPTDLITLTSTSEFKQKDEILIELALVYFFNSLGKEEESAKHNSILRQLLSECINNDDTKPDIDIVPEANVYHSSISEPWRDPFVKDV